MRSRLQKQGHVNQRVTDGNRLDIRTDRESRFVSGQRQRFVCGSNVFFAGDFLPDNSVNPIRIAPSW